jgi:hypothetical protein
VVPSSFPAGQYDVVVSNPGTIETGRIPQGYSVLGASSDNIYVVNTDLWTDPPTVRQNESVLLGLNLHRIGGTTTVQVPVSFYLGDPLNGGILLGSVTSVPIPPNTSLETVFLNWSVGTLVGPVTLTALVDPNDTLGASTQMSNKAVWTITVLAPAPDNVPPNITNLILDGGSTETSIPTASIAISASDQPNGSGLATMYLVERTFNSSAQSWIPIQTTGWVPYAASTSMTLSPEGGVRYIQAYVADAAGNISVEAVKAMINYLPPTDSLLANQVRIYRQSLNAGDTLSLTVQPISGDADLYIWGPSGNSVLVSNKAGTALDQGTFVATEAGEYQIEVYASTDTTYSIGFVPGAATGHLDRARLTVPTTDPSKQIRTSPIIAVDDVPEDRSAIPAAPVSATLPTPTSVSKVYLPVIVSKLGGGW